MAKFDLHDFKKQASFFLREKLNDARLALTDVSRMQLLTEEATNEDPWGPETKTMAMLADAAFELEEYERIVQVIHHRLDGTQKRPWRQLYKTLVVLEYLLTHGPKSLGREFKMDIHWVDELSQFNLTDQQGIDRGLMVRKKADRVLELLNNPDFRNEERTRAIKISVGIQGFGSTLHHQVCPQDAFRSIEQQCGSNNCEEYFANELTNQLRNGGAQILQVELKGVQYEKCASMSLQPKEDSSSSPVREQSLSQSSQEKRPYKKSLSSPGYFRERLPLLRWQQAHESILESEDADIHAVKETDFSSCEDVQGGLVGDVISEDLRRACYEDAHPLLEGIDTCSLADICKSSVQHSKISSFPVLPRTAIPRLRMRYQRNWQPARLIDFNVKFGKAA